MHTLTCDFSALRPVPLGPFSREPAHILKTKIPKGQEHAPRLEPTPPIRLADRNHAHYPSRHCTILKKKTAQWRTSSTHDTIHTRVIRRRNYKYQNFFSVAHFGAAILVFSARFFAASCCCNFSFCSTTYVRPLPQLSLLAFSLLYLLHYPVTYFSFFALTFFSS